MRFNTFILPKENMDWINMLIQIILTKREWKKKNGNSSIATVYYWEYIPSVLPQGEWEKSKFTP